MKRSVDIEDLERQYERAKRIYHEHGSRAKGKAESSPEFKSYRIAANGYVLAGEALARARKTRKTPSVRSR